MKLPGFSSGGGSGAGNREPGFLGIALECEPRGQISGQTPGVFENPTTDDFIVDSVLECGTYEKGANWDLYADAAVAKGANASHIVETATTVKFTESSTIPFMSLFDVIVVNTFQNGGVSPIFVKKIKDAAALTVRRGLTARPPHIILHGWKDDMPTGPHTSSLWAHYYYACRDNALFMRGTGDNADGIECCDPAEGNAWNGSIVDFFQGEETPFGTVSGHQWELDYRIWNFADVMATAARAQFDDYWNASGGAGESVDAFQAHDLLPFFGGVYRGETNAPTVDSAEWRKACERICDAYRKKFLDHPTLGKFWTSTGRYPGRLLGGGTDIDGLGGIFYSYHFVNDVADIVVQTKADITRARQSGRPIVFGNQEMDAVFDPMFETADHPDWLEILEHARRQDWTESTFLASSNTSYLFWTPAMRPLA